MAFGQLFITSSFDGYFPQITIQRRRVLEARAGCSVADEFIQTFDDLRKIFGCGTSQPGANTFNRESSYLTDLHP